jgi:RHS repeat-associated protein
VAIGATPFKVSFQETFTYAGRDGRVSQRVLTQATNDGAVSESFTQSWTYDVLGNVISLGYPDCTLAPCTSSPRTVSSTYTKGFLTGVTGFASSLTYHPNLQVNQVTNANGVVTTYAMDPNHMARPASIATTSATPWSSGAYAYDGAGNVTRIGNGRFLYDGVSRLVEGVTVITPADSTTTRTQTVGYDLYGNIQSITTNGAVVSTPTNTANRLTSSGTFYDAAGSMTSWNWGATFQYDALGLLWHYTSGAEDWLYMYTADDERVWAFRTAGSGNFWAIRDLDGKVLREYSTHAGWTVDRDYVYRGDKLLAAVTPQGTRHFHLDHLGSVRQVTNASAAQVAFHAYYPFGREATTLGQDNKEQMQFTGHERDLQNTTAGTNSDADDLDYMHARYYNMHVGRFTSVDPIGGNPRAPQSWNRYAYVLGNPLKFIDPRGLAEVDFCKKTSCHGSITVTGARPSADPLVALNGLNSLASGRAALDQAISAGSSGIPAGLSFREALDFAIATGQGGDFTSPTAIMLGEISELASATRYLELGVAAVTLGSGVGVLVSSAAVAPGAGLTVHAAGQAAAKNISAATIRQALQQGVRAWDPRNGLVTFILREEAGKSVIVGVNPSTGWITTVIRTAKVSSRYRILPQ